MRDCVTGTHDQNLTSLASINLYSHRHVTIPCARMNADETRGFDWWIKSIHVDVILVVVPLEHLR